LPRFKLLLHIKRDTPLVPKRKAPTYFEVNFDHQLDKLCGICDTKTIPLNLHLKEFSNGRPIFWDDIVIKVLTEQFGEFLCSPGWTPDSLNNEKIMLFHSIK
jgi:hypothetical protein